MKIYVAVGHGKTPSGVEDPGAVSGQFQEHTLARQVAMAYTAALIRCGVDTFLEPEPDPDYIGSTANANAWQPDYGEEIHFNAGGGTGCEVLYHPATSIQNQHRAALMSQSIAIALGIQDRGAKPRSDLYWLNGTNFPALLPEVAFVDNSIDQSRLVDPGFAIKVGEAMARATTAALMLIYKPPSPTPSPVVPPPAPAPRPPISPVPAWPGRLLKIATPMMHGADISLWQSQMARRGWGIGIDGWYGRQSEAVCRAFQQEKHLGVDGIVGPVTWTATWNLPVR